jgi:hypothetical protein
MRNSSFTMAAIALLLSACTSAGDNPQRALVAPGKYILYDCVQLAPVEARLVARNRELERLKTRAKQGGGGDLVSALVYEPDYLQNLGELDDVRREQTEKKCAPGGAPARPRR